jgi:hypothetical protein
MFIVSSNFLVPGSLAGALFFVERRLSLSRKAALSHFLGHDRKCRRTCRQTGHGYLLQERAALHARRAAQYTL